MWLSRCAVSGSGEETETISIGNVTIGGNPMSVLTESEVRNVVLSTPGGYYWVPKAGDEVVMLQCAGGECTVVSQYNAAEVDSFQRQMHPGECMLYTSGGARIWMKNDGSIHLSGDVQIDGSLSVNGKSYVPCACEDE